MAVLSTCRPTLHTCLPQFLRCSPLPVPSTVGPESSRAVLGAPGNPGAAIHR